MTKPSKPRNVKAPRASKAKAPASAAQHLRAHVYHEIRQGDGVLCVNPGDVVVRDGHSVTVMPAERYREAFPDRAAG